MINTDANLGEIFSKNDKTACINLALTELISYVNTSND